MRKLLLGFGIGFVFGVLVGLFGSLNSAYAEDDNPRTYKQYLTQMLYYMRKIDAHLENIEINTKAVKEKFHA